MTPDFEARWVAYRQEQSHGGYEYHPGDEHIFRDAWNLAIAAAAASLPDNWCDSLLTGPKGIKVPADYPNVEKLLRGARERIEGMKQPPVHCTSEEK